MDTDRATQRCTILTELKNGLPSAATATTPSAPTNLKVTTTTTVNSANAAKPIVPATPVTGNPAPSQTYSMYDASSDLIQYYEAGTFTHALQALEAKTGSQATASKQAATDAKTDTNTTSTTTSTASTCSPPS